MGQHTFIVHLPFRIDALVERNAVFVHTEWYLVKRAAPPPSEKVVNSSTAMVRFITTRTQSSTTLLRYNIARRAASCSLAFGCAATRSLHRQVACARISVEGMEDTLKLGRKYLEGSQPKNEGGQNTPKVGKKEPQGKSLDASFLIITGFCARYLSINVNFSRSDLIESVRKRARCERPCVAWRPLGLKLALSGVMFCSLGSVLIGSTVACASFVVIMDLEGSSDSERYLDALLARNNNASGYLTRAAQCKSGRAKSFCFNLEQ
eukprot:166260-Pleurochrysis_carterae.AAC.3